MSGEPIDLLDALQRSVEKAISYRNDQRNPTMKKTDVSKAPKYVRDYVRHLEQRIDSLEEVLERTRREWDDDSTGKNRAVGYVKSLSHESIPVARANERITFQPEGDERGAPEFYVAWRDDEGGYLEVAGLGKISIQPWVTNVVRVTSGGRA